MLLYGNPLLLKPRLLGAAQEGLLQAIHVVWPLPSRLTLLRKLVVFGLLLHLPAPALHACRLGLQQFQEPVAVSSTQRPPAAKLGDAAAAAAAPIPALQPRVWRRQRRGVQGRVQAFREGRRAASRGGALKDLPGSRWGWRRVARGVPIVYRVLSGRGARGLAGAVDHDFILRLFDVTVEVGRGGVVGVWIAFWFRGHAAGATGPETRREIRRRKRSVLVFLPPLWQPAGRIVIFVQLLNLRNHSPIKSGLTARIKQRLGFITTEHSDGSLSTLLWLYFVAWLSIISTSCYQTGQFCMCHAHQQKSSETTAGTSSSSLMIFKPSSQSQRLYADSASDKPIRQFSDHSCYFSLSCWHFLYIFLSHSISLHQKFQKRPSRGFHLDLIGSTLEGVCKSCQIISIPFSFIVVRFKFNII